MTTVLSLWLVNDDAVLVLHRSANIAYTVHVSTMTMRYICRFVTVAHLCNGSVVYLSAGDQNVEPPVVEFDS
jgi:hypothetical protein